MMRGGRNILRRVIVVVTVAALCAVFLATVAARDQRSSYLVKAIFDNASAAIPGEDVKIAGTIVGSIESLSVTPSYKAAVVLKIDTPGFQRFNKDATCIVRLASLIGEKFIECDRGTRAAGELELVSGDDQQRLLPVTQTSSPIDIDIAANTLRMPYRERLRIILSELGAGLAGKGTDINEIIRRSNPALRETDRVLKTLDNQNRELVKLLEGSAKFAEAAGRERKHIVSSFDASSQLSRDVLSRRKQFSQTFERLPAFLAELEPTMRELRKFAKSATPVAADVRQSAPDASRFVTKLDAFATEAGPALEEFSKVSATIRKAIPEVAPFASDLKTFAADGRPAIGSLADLLTSFSEQGGTENAAATIFGLTSAVNGFDSYGHFIRAALAANVCVLYNNTTSVQRDCAARYDAPPVTQAPGTKKANVGAARKTRTQSPEEVALEYLVGGER